MKFEKSVRMQQALVTGGISLLLIGIVALLFKFAGIGAGGWFLLAAPLSGVPIGVLILLERAEAKRRASRKMTREGLTQHFENDPVRKEFAEALKTGEITGDVGDAVLEFQERFRQKLAESNHSSGI